MNQSEIIEKKQLYKPTLVIGEVAQSHDGSLGMAHAFIDAIANAGADGVKFQTHIAAAETTLREPWRIRFSQQDSTRYDYWKRMEFSEEQWHGLRQHVSDRGLLFLSSPFSIEAVELLERVGVYSWKVASGEVSNLPLLERMTQSRLPVWLSSGMSSMVELDVAASLIQESGCELTVFQCTTMYPTPPEKIGLNMLPLLRQRYQCNIGLSDHSGTIFSGLSAVTIGIDVLEIHVTLSRESFGPDVSASVTTSELRQLVEGVRFIEEMKSQPVDKDAMSVVFEPLRTIFNKSIVARCDLPAGIILNTDMLAFKKPGTGLPPANLVYLIGKRINRTILADQEIREDDLEEA